MADITTAELREQYDRTGLDRDGIIFERAMQLNAVALSLRIAIKARHRRESKQARSAAINYQTRESA